RLDEIRMGEQGRLDAGGEELVVAQRADRVDSVPEILPELADVVGSREAPGHAEDRDIGFIGCGRHSSFLQNIQKQLGVCSKSCRMLRMEGCSVKQLGGALDSSQSRP